MCDLGSQLGVVVSGCKRWSLGDVEAGMGHGATEYHRVVSQMFEQGQSSQWKSRTGFLQYVVESGTSSKDQLEARKHLHKISAEAVSWTQGVCRSELAMDRIHASESPVWGMLASIKYVRDRNDTSAGHIESEVHF
ncbi:hypothetical protein SUGI_0165530 [Cryptomeria japonica]|nr:hypothetical protein SUGI_0165530 [Cryptomeria japonica]